MLKLDSSTAVSIFVDISVELTNTVRTVFVNSTNVTTNIEAAALSIKKCRIHDFHIFIAPLKCDTQMGVATLLKHSIF